jgi:hypothetical protein
VPALVIGERGAVQYLHAHWQAKEISRVLKMGIPEGEDINISLLEHVSPIEWENVILYGQYVLNPDDIR